MKRFKIILPLIVFLILMLLLWQGLQHDVRKLPSVLINQKAPIFSMVLLGVEQQTLSNKDFEGHISLLNVWATWCVECKEEFPILMKIAQDKKIHLYGLNYKDDPSAAMALLKARGNPYLKTGVDPHGSVAIDFGVYGAPETFLIDKQGVIRYRYVGPITNDAWQHQFLPRIERLEAE